ncbi:unnamed protein product [Brassica oleracea]
MPIRTTATAAAQLTHNIQIEQLLDPETACTRCRTEQNGLPPPQSLIRAQTCTQLPAHHHMRLKQTYEVLGCERRPSVRCGDQRHENHHMPQDLREPATELEHQPACVLNPTTRRRGNRTHQHTPRRKKKVPRLDEPSRT